MGVNFRPCSLGVRSPCLLSSRSVRLRCQHEVEVFPIVTDFILWNHQVFLEKRKKFKNRLYEQTLTILKSPLSSVNLIAINIKSSDIFITTCLRFTNSQSRNPDFHECLLFLSFRQNNMIWENTKFAKPCGEQLTNCTRIIVK